MIDKNALGTLFPLYTKIKAAGQHWAAGLNGLIAAGNDPRLAVKNSKGRTQFEVSLMLAIVTGIGVVFFLPFLAALGVIAAWAAQVQVVVERYEEPVYAVVETSKNGRLAAAEFEGRKPL